MKSIYIASLIVVFLFSTHSSADVIRCSKGETKISVIIDETYEGVLRIDNTAFHTTEYYDIKLDRISRSSSSFVFSTSDISTAQKQYNSVLVFRLSKETGNGNIEYRDYDDDYTELPYYSEDKGPLSNGYVLRPNSVRNIDCPKIK